MTGHRVRSIALLLLFAFPAIGGVNRWTITGPESAGVANQIVFDPGDSSIVYCAALNGLFRSTDHSTVAVAQADPRIVYAASGLGLYRSDDRGVTWRAVNAAVLFSMAVSPPGAALT